MTFLRKRGTIFRELVTHTKIIYLHVVKIYRYTPPNNNLFLIPDLFVRPIMTYL